MSDLEERCKVFVRRIASCLIELVTVRNFSGDLQSNRICRVHVRNLLGELRGV